MKQVEVEDYTKQHTPSQYHLQEKEDELVVSSCLSMWNTLILPIASSTYIRTFAILDVFRTSEGSICIDAALLGGIHSVAILVISSSRILNPLSAITSS